MSATPSTHTSAAARTGTDASNNSTAEAASPPTGPPGVYVGSPDPLSLIWPLHIVPRAGETELEAELRRMRLAAVESHRAFWTRMNSTFQERRAALETAAASTPGQQGVSAEDLSRFYQRHIADHGQSYVEFGRSVRRQNWAIVRLGLRVAMYSLTRGRIR